VSAPSSAAVIRQLSDALDATVQFGQRRLGSRIWPCDPGSEAQVEVANSELGNRCIPWGERPPRTAYALAAVLMKAVLDNLASFRRLLGDEMLAIGPTVVARSAIEISSTVWWLMEPGIGIRKRVSRELVLSLASARRAGYVAQKLHENPDRTAAITQESQVLRRVKELGLPTPSGPFLSPKIENEELKRPTDVTADMLDPWLPPSTPSSNVYLTYSAVSHGELYGLMHFLTPEAQVDGSTMLRWERQLPIVESTVDLAIIGFRESYLRISKVMGWGCLEDQLWEDKLRRIYN
jgi:hypothetical protein